MITTINEFRKHINENAYVYPKSFSEKDSLSAQWVLDAEKFSDDNGLDFYPHGFTFDEHEIQAKCSFTSYSLAGDFKKFLISKGIKTRGSISKHLQGDYTLWVAYL